MTMDKKFKQVVREYARKNGMSYQRALVQFNKIKKEKAEKPATQLPEVD